MVAPPPHWKIRRIDPPSTLENPIPSMGGGGGGMDIFWNHTLYAKKRLWSQAFLVETMETGNKNRCMTEAMHVLQRKL